MYLHVRPPRLCIWTQIFNSGGLGQTPVWSPVPGKFKDIVSQDPSDSKSSRLHVDIFRFLFIYLRYIL
jgi:hypothetical protein